PRRGGGRPGGLSPLPAAARAWAGLPADPSTADGAAITAFNQALNEGRYTPEVFTASPSNAFAGRDVTAIALQLPDAALGSTRVGLWARISLDGHVPQRQVDRISQARCRSRYL